MYSSRWWTEPQVNSSSKCITGFTNGEFRFYARIFSSAMRLATINGGRCSRKAVVKTS